LFDVAAFHIILANSAAHLDRERGLEFGQKSVEADKYHFLALQSINERIAGPASDISEGLIGAVAGFLVHNVGAHLNLEHSPINNSTGSCYQF
jgi:hypothetical protein